MADKGWIKLHRSLSDWQWYDDNNCVRLLVHLLITVNYEDKYWKGELIRGGSRVFSWEKLAKEVGTTTRQLRTSMSRLEKSGEVTRQAFPKWQVVTLVKWGELQDTRQANDKEVDTQTTSKRQPSAKQTTTTKEPKNNRKKEIKKEEIIMPFESEKFELAWEGWKKFKKDQFRFTYKSAVSEQTALKKLLDLSKGNEQFALLIIEQSVAQGWKGFFELRNAPQQGSNLDDSHASILRDINNRNTT